jgi:hypothetical protein
MTRMLVLLALLVSAAARPAAAQRLAGITYLPDGRSPAAGVIITAHDANGMEIAQTVTRDDGRFLIFIDSAGPMTLRAYRLGFRPADIHAATIVAGDDALPDTIRATLPAAALELDRALRRGATTCGGREDARAALTELLGEARRTMQAARFRIGRGEIAARFATFQHRTAKNGEDTLRSTIRRGSGPLPSLFPPVATEQLEATGFFATIAGERVFHAPDLDVLLSPWFNGTHCFTLRRIATDSLIVAYAPARERRGLVDVSGEYIFDRRSLEFRRVSFQYVGLPPEERESGAGGVIDFVRASNGNRHADHWYQRTPFLGYRQADGTTTFVRSTMTVVDVIAHFVTGGRVTAISAGERLLVQRGGLVGAEANTPAGRACPERLVTAATGAARGRIVPDSGRMAGGILVRAVWEVPVVIARTQMSTREMVRETLTDDTGAWLLCDIPVGRETSIRWTVRDEERSVPLLLTTPGAIADVAMPAGGDTVGTGESGPVV